MLSSIISRKFRIFHDPLSSRLPHLQILLYCSTATREYTRTLLYSRGHNQLPHLARSVSVLRFTPHASILLCLRFMLLHAHNSLTTSCSQPAYNQLFTTFSLHCSMFDVQRPTNSNTFSYTFTHFTLHTYTKIRDCQ